MQWVCIEGEKWNLQHYICQSPSPRTQQKWRLCIHFVVNNTHPNEPTFQCNESILAGQSQSQAWQDVPLNPWDVSYSILDGRDAGLIHHWWICRLSFLENTSCTPNGKWSWVGEQQWIGYLQKNWSQQTISDHKRTYLQNILDLKCTEWIVSRRKCVSNFMQSSKSGNRRASRHSKKLNSHHNATPPKPDLISNLEMEQSLDFANLPFPYCNIFATCVVQMFYQILMFLWVVVSNVVNWVGRKREDGWRVEMRIWLVVLLLLLLLLLTTMTMTRTVVRRCGVAAGLGEVVLSASWCWIELNWMRVEVEVEGVPAFNQIPEQDLPNRRSFSKP